MSDLVVGEVRGYRAWQLGDGHLHALSSSDHPWESASKEAACTLAPMTWEGHPAPFTGCTCGLYAYYRPTTVPASFRQVFGVVAVAGRVILATRGMKAERMTILALVTDDAALGERYGVPIYPNREALLADYPPQEYSGLVDVDPWEPWVLSIGGWPATVGVNTGFVARKRTAAEQMAELVLRGLPARLLPARVVAARVMAAQVGVNVAMARRRFRDLSAADRADVTARARQLWRAQKTSPSGRRARRDSTRR